jgi:transcriptional regulator with XRE-family HTH domain
MEIINAKLQKVRKTLDLTQNQVADKLGISRNTMINIEKGETSIDLTLLDKLAHLYGYSISYFINDDEEEKELSFAFRATELNEEDSFITAWGSRVLKNIRDLQEIYEEVNG